MAEVLAKSPDESLLEGRFAQSKFFPSASDAHIAELISVYSNVWEYGAPHRTGKLNNWYLQFKPLAVILGVLIFTHYRRSVLEVANKVHQEALIWSYLSSFEQGTSTAAT
ncbi:hypothetical protein PABG_07334 [Paracoccidioides brasiliensis Pb03]|nr:hypothetical protein PABG_07334 [Paracoccidioides brasiliensis Pb03]